IKVQVPGGGRLIASDPMINVQAEWLTGAVASELNVQLEGRVENSQEEFEGFEGYSFTDMTRLASNQGTSFEKTARLNTSGEALIRPELGYLGNSAGMLNLVLGTRVYEPGGRFSINRTVLPL